jgi:hypothetical protein
MPARTLKITLANNTPFALYKVGTSGPCEGTWTQPLQPPDAIQPKSQATWESESDFPLTGTEGWIKYIIDNNASDSTGQLCAKELVYIHWDNPLIWDNDTKPLDFAVVPYDVTPPCDQNMPGYTLSTPGEFNTPFTGSGRSQNCRHDLFVAELNFDGPIVYHWYDLVPIGWLDLILNYALATGATDIKISATLALRQTGSVLETIFSFYDGKLGLRSLARGESSVRALLRI